MIGLKIPVGNCIECFHFSVCKYAEKWKDVKQDENNTCGMYQSLLSFEELKKTFGVFKAITNALDEERIEGMKEFGKYLIDNSANGTIDINDIPDYVREAQKKCQH